MLRILSITSLFPNPVQPGLGVNVERQVSRLSALPDVEVEVVAPVPRFPLNVPGMPYADLAKVPQKRHADGYTVHHPRFATVPVAGWRTSGDAIARAALPLARRLHEAHSFHLVAGEYFFPDAWAIHRTARSLYLPYAAKARGSDIRFWSKYERARRQMVAAGRYAGALFAVSEALRDDMVNMGLPRERIDVHYTGVDLESFTPAAAEIRDPSRLVTVGNLVDIKRHSLLINALAHLPGMTLEIIGDGPLRSKLEAEAKQLRLADRVTFAGRIGHDELPRRLASAAALVHASETEGLANVWVEALACGTPVVTTQVGGAAEVIVPGSGALVPVSVSAKDFADAVLNLLIEPAAYPSRLRTVAERFSWDRNLRQLTETYRRLARLN